MKRKILKHDLGARVVGSGTQSNTGTSDASNQNSNTPQTPSSPKWLNTFGDYAQYGSVLSGFFPEKSEYSGTKGALAGGLDSTYDMTSDFLMSKPPWGTLVGGAMKLGSLAGKGLNALGVGTDGQTTADAILGSSFFNWNVGLVNALGAKKTNTIEQDKETWSRAGNSYMGALGLNQDAINKSGKKYGLFSRKQYKQVNNFINEQGRRQNILGDITDYQSDRMETLANQQDMINTSYFNSIRGGYDQSAVRAAKQGGILNDFKAFQLAHKIAYNNLHTKQDKVDQNAKEDEIQAFQNGGQMSLIPEGALHKNKHHIEDANPDLKGEITEKGIPVVDKEGEQVCEIERNEIIFSKELTDQIEQLRDMYNKAESQKDKDEVARRAGEAISNEVFENTDDRTGLIKDIQE